MSDYKILPRTYEKAREIGALIQPSKRPNKKLDVLFNDKVYSIGENGMMDYPYWLEVDIEKANNRRRLYLKRHLKENSIKSYLAKKLLWD